MIFLTQIIELAKQLNIDCIQNESMKKHTTFKIGGDARVMVFPKTAQHIADIVKLCNQHNIRYMAIGNGSNLLVSDDGIDACVIVVGKDFADVSLVDETTIYAQAGASLTKVCRFALENSLTGLEFAFGIPGTCGGGAFMNAGAYGGELKDVLIKSEHIDKDGNIESIDVADMNLSYRHSAYYDNGCIISGLYFKLQKGDSALIKEKMDELMQRRKDKQPVELPSAGSTFKRPEGYFAGALIEQCNLKGASVGDAQVSTKHAGFVINKGNATCKDVLDLCSYVSKTVQDQKGVALEMEIRVTK